MIQRLPTLTDFDKKRILECLGCKYYRRCEQTVKEPKDDLDGRCLTKKLFEEGIYP